MGSAPNQPSPDAFSHGSANATAAGTKYASKARDMNGHATGPNGIEDDESDLYENADGEEENTDLYQPGDEDEDGDVAME